MTPPGVMPKRASLWRLPGFRDLSLLTVAGFAGYFFLLSVAPLWAVVGGAGERGAGLVTGALLATTIATQPFVPRLLARFGAGATLAAGLVALGAPSPLYALSADLGPLLTVSGLRGIGFGILTVSGSSLVAALAPADRRGEGVGVYGLAIAIPQLICLPLGVFLAQQVGFGWVFALGTAPLLGIPSAIGLGRRGQDHFRRSAAMSAAGGVAWRVVLAVAVPSLFLTVVTAAGGGLVTFLPIAFESAAMASAALLIMSGVAALSRWRAGRLGDIYGAGRLTWPSLVVTTLGLAGTVAAVRYPGWEWVVLPAMLVFGLGYGAVQNLTLVSAFSRAGPRHFGVASAAWNIGFDAGTALGAIAFGAIAQSAGFGWAFTVGMLAVAACVPMAVVAARARGGRG